MYIEWVSESICRVDASRALVPLVGKPLAFGILIHSLARRGAGPWVGNN